MRGLSKALAIRGMNIAPILIKDAVEHDNRIFVSFAEGALQLVSQPARHDSPLLVVKLVL